ncbi:3-methyl-2-oxobutanoate hydroxymethyltransferase [Corynebacterium renale]|uniref:3-methyl-2-oxobutanoate hydroxymethyltransferase n=1 Tax=Corynebacterium renale TaxID=1724 RepID=UPI000DA2EC85|nr:3-methyl-2-oxobutanoate hydroxymethyltransferase [Corynebacterium renale]SQG63862.1 3-methyl-2-oxobutanoate hydroxymethyltransferase [Corynebacterium renale]STD02484.1 3-methyl-2-oxobutanoate hydroxymethyltransferase [Corynebacterium renale]
MQRLRTRYFSTAKAQGRPFTALTSYDTMSARIFDEAGIDLLLVGDSAANVVFGHASTLPVTLDEMISLASAVVRSTQRAFVLVDLPFGSYEEGAHQALRSAARVMKESGAHGVKLEGGAECAPTIRALVAAGIPVCAHIGFTPQSEHALGGYVVQGRGEAAQSLIQDATAVAEAGAFAIVLEMVPADIAGQVTQSVSVPTIGIGAGNATDGQILVWTDAFGFNAGAKTPKFVRQYADLGDQLLAAAREYKADVENHTFPNQSESF